MLSPPEYDASHLGVITRLFRSLTCCSTICDIGVRGGPIRQWVRYTVVSYFNMLSAQVDTTAGSIHEVFIDPDVFVLVRVCELRRMGTGLVFDRHSCLVVEVFSGQSCGDHLPCQKLFITCHGEVLQIMQQEAHSTSPFVLFFPTLMAVPALMPSNDTHEKV